MIGVGIGMGHSRGREVRPDPFVSWRGWRDEGAMDFAVPTIAVSWFAPQGAGAVYSIMDFGVATT